MSNSQFSNDPTWNVAYLQSPAHNIAPKSKTLAPHVTPGQSTPLGNPHPWEVRTPGTSQGHGAWGMGPSAGVQNPNLLLRDFIQERWKGLTPILWGQQLKQERLDELIYLCLMNADHLPDEELTSPMTDFYAGMTAEVSETSAVSDEASHA